MALPRRFLSGDHSSVNPPSSAVTPESDFVVILAALLCAVICVVGLVMVARCAWLRRSRAGANGGASGQSSSNKGLKKKVLRSLPKFTYGGAAEKEIPADCAICLTEYEQGDEIRVLPQCRHGFHVQCIDTWLGSHSSCPSCRQILVVARCRKCGCKEIPSLYPKLGANNSGIATPCASSGLSSNSSAAALRIVPALQHDAVMRPERQANVRIPKGALIAQKLFQTSDTMSASSFPGPSADIQPPSTSSQGSAEPADRISYSSSYSDSSSDTSG
nr:RING-H2 finger protein ATL80-like [Ipomoea batatas]GMD17498.1 RING-H2 finger protein ATL80-like [Ipomoea batatas]